MPINVLVASADLDVHELVADILEIIFKEVNLDRVMDIDRVREKIHSGEFAYNLILLDYHICNVDGKTDLLAIDELPQPALERLVIIVDAAEGVTVDPGLENIPMVTKPFSLDEFDHIVRSACR